MLKDSSSPYNNFSICNHKDVERTLLALVDPSERQTLIELREHQENVIVQLESLQTSVSNENLYQRYHLPMAWVIGFKSLVPRHVDPSVPQLLVWR